MKKYFGTDGIRGIVGEFLTPELALKTGRAVGLFKDNIKVVVAKDTRISGDMIMCALVSGLVGQGANVDIIGLSTTPALAYVTKDNYDFGIMLTASHNPYNYNGIKIFDKTGNKLSEEDEKQLEKIIDNTENYKYSENIGEIEYKENLLNAYIDSVKTNLTKKYYNLKICIDLANGGAILLAKKLFKEKQFKKLTFINSQYNGKIINKNCGATNLEMLKNFVIDKGYDIGFAYDGDADRIMIVSNNGEVVDGDDILFLLIKYEYKNLPKKTVVGTVMTNYGLEDFLNKRGLKLKRVGVGDKNIKECMVKDELWLGGENSGHIITNTNCTGDAIFVTTKIINILNKTKKQLSTLLLGYKKYPNVLTNIKLENKNQNSIVDSGFMKKIIDKYQKVLENNGRIFVRASGTEPLIRVLVEGKNEKDVLFVSNGICADIEKYITEIN